MTGIPWIGGPLDALLTTRQPQDPLERHFHKVDLQFLQRQEDIPIRGMLGASVGDWPFVVQGLDIKRDLQSHITQLLQSAKRGPALMIIVGRPGSGKSTLMRRIGVDMALAGYPVWELRPGRHRSADWFHFVADLPTTTPPSLVLIDDIFRCEGLDDLLTDQCLNCIILGTSRTNEDRTTSLRVGRSIRFIQIPHDASQPSWPVLDVPSLNELSVLRKRSECTHFSDREWRDITTMMDGARRVPAPLLVIMLQIAGGGPFEQIVADTISQLRRTHPSTYKALGIISAFHRWGLETPTSILNLLMGDQRFVRLLRSDISGGKRSAGAQDLIYRTESIQDVESWRTAHQLIAETAVSVEYSDFAQDIYEDLLELLEHSLEDVSSYLCRLFTAVTNQGEHDLAARIAGGIERNLDKYAQQPSVLDWAYAFHSTSNRVLASRCLRLVGFRPGMKAWTYFSMLAQYEGGLRALSIIAPLAQSVQADASLQTAYLRIADQHGSSLSRRRANDVVFDWIRARGVDPQCLTRLLLSVENFGDREQCRTLLAFTQSWLVANDDPAVQVAYLGLVQTRGSEDLKRSVLKGIRDWLGKHESSSIRHKFLTFVEHCGDEQDIRRAINDTATWLACNEDDEFVRVKFLSLVVEHGDDQDVQQSIAATSQWLRRNDDDESVRAAFIHLVTERAPRDQVLETMTATRDWLTRHEMNSSVRLLYLAWLAADGSAEERSEAIDQALAWLAGHDEDSGCRVQFLKLLPLVPDEELVRHGVIQTLDWIARHFVLNVLVHLLKVFEFKRVPEQKLRFIEILDASSHKYGLAEGYVIGLGASLAWDLEPIDKVRNRFRTALTKLLTVGKSQHHIRSTRFAYARFLAVQVHDYEAAEIELRWLATTGKPRDRDLDLWAHCLAKLGRDDEAEAVWKQCIAQASPKRLMLCHIAVFYRERGRYPEAREAVRRALEEVLMFYWALKELGELEAADGNPDEARKLFRMAYASVPELPRFHDQTRETIRMRSQELFGEDILRDDDGRHFDVP